MCSPRKPHGAKLFSNDRPCAVFQTIWSNQPRSQPFELKARCWAISDHASNMPLINMKPASTAVCHERFEWLSVSSCGGGVSASGLSIGLSAKDGWLPPHD